MGGPRLGEAPRRGERLERERKRGEAAQAKPDVPHKSSPADSKRSIVPACCRSDSGSIAQFMEVWRMLKSATLVVALCTASATAAWAEPLVRHAGEWETTIDNGKPILFCYPTDVTLNQGYVLQSMSKIPGAN